MLHAAEQPKAHAPVLGRQSPAPIMRVQAGRSPRLRVEQWHGKVLFCCLPPRWGILCSSRRDPGVSPSLYPSWRWSHLWTRPANILTPGIHPSHTPSKPPRIPLTSLMSLARAHTGRSFIKARQVPRVPMSSTSGCDTGILNTPYLSPPHVVAGVAVRPILPTRLGVADRPSQAPTKPRPRGLALHVVQS